MKLCPLIDETTLQKIIPQEETIVLDASWALPGSGINPTAAFLKQRIPGARFFDIDVIADLSQGLPHMLPDPETFQNAARSFGISAESTVVIYDSNQFMASARAWWMFKVYGHDRVQVLDGGLSKWLSSGFETECGPPDEALAPSGNFVSKYRERWLMDFKTLQQDLGDPNIQILDARPSARFQGLAPEPRPGLRSGHIPGSLSLPFQNLLDLETGRLLQGEKLKSLLAQHGYKPQRTTIASCGSGVTAAIIALALEGLEAPETRLYDGSWAEWGLPGDHPVTSGI